VAKLMQEQRRLVGDFELIDFLDEKQIAATREKLDVATPLTVRWNHWDYGHEIEELHALYEKGKQFQWNASQALDWDTPVSRDEWLGNPDVSQLVHVLRYKGADEATLKSALFDEINYVLSQLLHGEQAALQICGQLTNACPTNDEKLYAAQQAADEARHSEVLARFLAQKMGTIYPVSPNIKILLEELLRAETYYKKTLGMQTLFEGVAMGILDGLGMTMTNPLLVDMLQRVKLDESRHAAFGVLTMRRCVRDVSEAERHGLEDWTFGILEALNANQQMHMMRTLGPKYGVDPDRWIGKALAFEHWPIMNSGVYMHTVMPNLQRLGLVSERTEAKYRKLGMLSDIRQSA
jgi:para-aminobenzoate N-oxygenase AurF